MNANQTVDYRNLYGASETNGLVDGAAYHAAVDYTRFYSLGEIKDLGGKITRVRILTERTFGGTLCDISYITATLPNGQMVNVQSHLNNLTPRRELKKAMLDWAQREGVYAKGIGLIDESNWSIL